MSTLAYIGAAPTSGSKTLLIVAVVLFIIAAVVSFPARAWPYAIAAFSTLLAAGLVALTLAFLIS